MTDQRSKRREERHIHQVIGRRMCHCRQELGLSVQDAAKLLKITTKEYVRHELGEIPIPIGRLVLFARSFYMSPGWFVEGQ